MKTTEILPLEEQTSELAAYEGQTIVIKIGGNSIDEDPDFLSSLAGQLKFLQKHKVHNVVVHGGGPQIDRALKAANITSTRGPDGRRLTTPAMMDVVARTMGEISAEVAASLTSRACPVFVAADENACFVKAVPVQTNGTVAKDERTGMPSSVDAENLYSILATGKIVILTSVGKGQANLFYNINADDYAMAIAMALHARRLILATNVAGVIGPDKKIIPGLTPSTARKLFEDGTIAGGMIPKVESALKAVESGVGGVVILSAHEKDFLLKELLTRKGLGTLIAPESCKI
jgi:acetylglutamate kinase